MDESRVLIENRLEAGDQNQLGQILTCLAGLEGKTVAWIASSITDEQCSALNWLNQHTEDGFSFFAIRVKVVRIGNSLPAPIFDVVERPNTWDKQLHAAASASTSRTELAANRFAFWQAFVDQIPGELDRSGLPQYVSNRWRVLNDLGRIISLTLAKRNLPQTMARLAGQHDPFQKCPAVSLVQTSPEGHSIQDVRERGEALRQIEGSPRNTASPDRCRFVHP